MTIDGLTTGAGEDRIWPAGEVVEDLRCTNLCTTAKYATLSRDTGGRVGRATAPKTGQI